MTCSTPTLLMVFALLVVATASPTGKAGKPNVGVQQMRNEVKKSLKLVSKSPLGHAEKKATLAKLQKTLNYLSTKQEENGSAFVDLFQGEGCKYSPYTRTTCLFNRNHVAPAAFVRDVRSWHDELTTLPFLDRPPSDGSQLPVDLLCVPAHRHLRRLPGELLQHLVLVARTAPPHWCHYEELFAITRYLMRSACRHPFAFSVWPLWDI